MKSEVTRHGNSTRERIFVKNGWVDFWSGSSSLAPVKNRKGNQLVSYIRFSHNPNKWIYWGSNTLKTRLMVKENYRMTSKAIEESIVR